MTAKIYKWTKESGCPFCGGKDRAEYPRPNDNYYCKQCGAVFGGLEWSNDKVDEFLGRYAAGRKKTNV